LQFAYLPTLNGRDTHEHIVDITREYKRFLGHGTSLGNAPRLVMCKNLIQDRFDHSFPQNQLKHVFVIALRPY